MSTLKIKRDIELLEQQLEKIELEISDPIERIEQKKQLEKKLKKLKQSKNQIEELELLKSEFTLDINDSIDKRESEQQKPTVPVNDTFIVIESEVNINQQVQDNWNNQVDNIDLSKKTSDTTTLITPQANNSKEFAKAWIIGGTIGFFIFLGLVINGNKASQVVTNKDFEQPTSDTIASDTFKQDNLLEEQEVIESSSDNIEPFQSDNTNNSTIYELENSNSHYNFPLDSCGDDNPGGENIWYPVYVDDTPENLNIVRNNYCRDAIVKYREHKQIKSIQVASFTDEFQAKEFAELMQVNIGSGEVGEPAVYNFDIY